MWRDPENLREDTVKGERKEFGVQDEQKTHAASTGRSGLGRKKAGGKKRSLKPIMGLEAFPVACQKRGGGGAKKKRMGKNMGGISPVEGRLLSSSEKHLHREENQGDEACT